MFLIVGLVTVILGVLVVFLLPDNPMKSRLTHEEKVWAIERLRENQTGIENKHFKFAQVIECFADPQTWLLSLITIASNVPNGAVSSYCCETKDSARLTLHTSHVFHVVRPAC